MQTVTVTDIGKIRKVNQDAVFANDKIAIVADGMGGHLAGDVASSTAISIILSLLENKNVSEQEIANAFIAANIRIFIEQKKNIKYKGMGTTITMLYETNQSVLIGHVGDSRCYLLRDGKFQQITTDHSIVGELINKGLISKDEAMIHPYRNVITRAVGVEKNVLPDTICIDKKPNDIFLVCSDGLSTMVKDEDMRNILINNNLKKASQLLLKSAINNGGNDNITLILAKIEKVIC